MHTARLLQIRRDAFIKVKSLLEPGGICMTKHFSQIVRPRPMPSAMFSLGAMSGYSGLFGC
jgi:hypothetical protein